MNLLVMSRRVFAKSIGFTIGATVAGAALIGCDNTTVAAFVTTIGKYAAQLASYFGASEIATDLVTDAAKIATDIANWQNGSASSDAIEVINDMIDLVNQLSNQVGFLSTYGVFIDLILGALAGLLALLPSSATSTVALSDNAHTAKLKAKGIARITRPPFAYGGFDKHSMTAANNGYVAQWNRYAMTLPTTK